MPVTTSRLITFFLAVFFLLLIPVWLFVIQPYIYRLPDDFSFNADVISFDNFFDLEKDAFLGEQRSVTTFSYSTKDVEDENQVIENVFDVKTITGEPIVSIAREYVVNRYTGEHVAHPLYEKRNGYLFAPRMKGFGSQVPDKSTFYYWHVNYNQALPLDFFGEKEVAGLPVYVYQTNAIVDQTNELSSVLPGVGTKYGMKLFVYIELMIEPYTGRLVSYQDKTDAIYTDLETGKELYPWNSFRNAVASHSIRDNANAAALLKQQSLFINVSVIVLLLLLSLTMFLFPTLKKMFTTTATLESPREEKRLLLPLVVAVLVFLGSAVFGYVLFEIINQQRIAEFETQAESTLLSIDNRLDIYKSILEGGVGLFNASNFVDRSEWKSYVESLDIQTKYPGIQGIGYAVFVPTSTKQEFISSVRDEGFPDFDITPADDRDDITSIVYLEPFDDRNKRAFGYDMFSEENRRIAMVYARDSGEASISGKITLLQETDQDIQPGFLMYLGVYENPIGEKTVDERRTDVLGYVYSPFRMNDFMKGVLFNNPTDIEFEVYDGFQVNSFSDDDLLFRSFESAIDDHFRYVNIINFGNRTWTVAFYAPQSFGLDVFRRQMPLIVFLMGVVLSILLFIVLYTVSSQRDRAVKMAHEMTKDLSKVTLEAQERAEEAEKLNKLMVDRELKMIEMKKKLRKRKKTK